MKNKLLMIMLFGSIFSWGQTFQQVTTSAGLTSGNYLIVGDGSTNDGIMLNSVSAGPIINYSVVTNPTATITTGFTSDNVFQISVSGSEITIYNSLVGYVSWGNTVTSTGTANNAGFSNGTLTNNEKWTTSVASSLWTLANVATPGRLLQWNSTAPRFAAYTSAQTKLKLYKEVPTGFSVTYIGNGNTSGTVPTDATSYASGVSVTVKTNSGTLAKTGYTFAGWNTLADGSGTNYTATGTDTFSITANTTLYAKWTANNNTITFDKNAVDATGTTVTQTLDTAVTANLTSNGFSRVGYTFAGWATTSTGTVAYADGASYLMGTSNVTLYAIWNTTAPFLTTSGTLSALTTIYGTASGNTTFTVSAGNLNNSLIIIPPSGFEISTSSGTGFTTSLNLGTSDRTNTIIYVRLATTTAVGTYNGTVSLTSTGVTSVNVATVSSSVTQKPLTITGLSGVNKIYDGLTTATLSGTAALNGIVFSDDVTLSGTPISNFADKNVGTGKNITTTGYTLSGTKAANYSVTQPTATANISAKALTISAPTISSKVYNASAVTGTVTAGTLSGLIGSETLMVTATGLYADANAGIAKPATVTYALANGSNGGLATNYSMANGAGTGDITKANPVFTVATIPVTVGGVYTLLGSNVVTTSDGVLSYSITAGGFATLSGTTISGVGIGTETLTVNQAASTNYFAGSTTVGVSVTTVTFANGDYRSINDGNWHGTASSGSTNTWQQLVSGVWTAISNSPPSNAAGLGTKTVYIRNDISLVGTNTAPNVVIENGGILTTIISSTFGNLVVKSGGIFNRNSTGSSIKVGGNFEIEDDGIAYLQLNNSVATTLSSTIWQGEEIFHPNSNVYITSTQNTSNYTIIPSINDIKPFNNSYFGNLIIDKSAGNSIVLLPVGFSGIFAAGNLIFRTSNNDVRFLNTDYSATINGNLIIEDTFTGRKVNLYASSSGTANVTILGNIVHNGDDNLNIGTTVGGTTNLYLKGDLFIGSTAKLISTTTTNSTFNFTGTGDGSTDATTQTIDVANQATASNIAFNVNSGSYTKLISQDFSLGTNSSFTAKTGAIFDFGFNNANVALNLINNGSLTAFSATSGSTLKITSPLGINSFGIYTGNVQVGATSVNRVFDVGATYHYIGKANQVIGNGISNAASNKYIIVELATDNLEFTSNNGIIRFNNPASAIGSNFRGFEIRKGTVIADDTGNRFEDSATTGEVGNLKMTGGIYKIFTKDIQPAVSGNYDLSIGSKIIFAHTTAATTTQAIRGGADYQYPEIEIEGKEVRYSNVNVNMKSNGLFTVKENAILTNTGNSGQIVSLNDANPATLTVKNTGIFKTEKEKGFSGVPDGINPSPSVRTNSTSGNVLVVLEPGSTVEYSRSGDQTITNATVTTPVNANYQNLTISGASGIKTLQNPTNTKVNEDLNVVSSKLLLNVSEIITVKKGVKIASGGAEFEIKNNGQLIQLDEADTNIGIGFKYNRIAMADNNDYVYWSSPVDAYNLDNILGADRYFWNPLNANANGTVGNWNPTSAATPMQKARGYIVKVPNSFSTTASPLLSLFEGKPNNGAMTFDIARAAIVNSEDDRWNLTGNPYPSAIDAEQFLTVNDTKINGAVWVWTHGQSPTNTVNPYYQNFAYNYYASDYVIYNKLGSSDPNTFNGKIAAGQGFMVNMLTSAATPNTISFANTMRTDNGLSSYNNSDFYKSSNPNSITAVDEKHRIWIDILNTTDGQKDRILLGYATNATLGKDHFYDCFYSPNTTEVGIYTLINSDPFSIQGRSLPFTNTDLVPLGVSIVTAGNHKIALSKIDGLFEAGQDIYLEDNLLHIIHDLKTSPYSFTSPIGVFNDRFVIRYTNATLSNPDFDASNNTVLVAVQNNQIMIKSAVEAISSVVVYDVLGREFTKLNAINQKEVTLNNVSDKNQALILKIILENGLIVTRKIIL